MPRWLLPTAGVLAVTSVTLLGLHYNADAEVAAAPAEPGTAREAPVAAAAAPLQAALQRAVEAYLELPVAVKFDGRTFSTTWKALGLEADAAGVAHRAGDLAAEGKDPGSIPPDHFARGDDGAPVPVALDRAVALEVLVGYKDSNDRPPLDARLDLENRQVIAEAPGFGVDVYESLALLEEAARTRQTEVNLAGDALAPHVTRAQLGNIDISHVLGWFETKYPPGEKLRNYNLKLAAEKLNGHVIMPGQVLSFNETVGERTEKEGYRVAHVIEAGEMIDGLAGGACQISSTLHAAAWFAGLERVYATPHSRPSVYITMGLDATVAWPNTDLKLRNPYDFPVVVRYVVSQGTVRVEVLGKERPYTKVAFEREIKKEIPFETITREDDSLPVGSQIVEQLGFPGYELIIRRRFLRDDEVVKVEKFNVRYPPTTEYVRMGTNPDPNLLPPVQAKLHGPQSPGGGRVWSTSQ